MMLHAQARERPSTGDDLPANAAVIEVRVGELRQLFNAIDPAPFHERDLDPKAEEFIVGWSEDLPRNRPIALNVIVDRGPGPDDEAAVLRQAIHQHFAGTAFSARRRLRELLRRGRVSLAIGLTCLTASILAGDAALSNAATGSRFAGILRESLLIGGWVAMWKPLEVFLYDWWPLLSEARLHDRLSAMPVRLTCAAEDPGETWRSDWPTTAACVRPPNV